MTERDKRLSVSLPGEWILQRVLGPVLDEIGQDLAHVYAKGRDLIVGAAARKVANLDDGKSANLRVSRDVFWNGAFTDDELSAEYFGGILAASRSEDGKDDDVIQFVDVTKSLSSRQIHLHYVIFNRLNKLLAISGEEVNVGLSTDVQKLELWLSTVELEHNLQLSVDPGLNVLWRASLISEYEHQSHDLGGGRQVPYARVRPTTFGILLYAVAHNRVAEWRQFATEDFGDFPNIALPSLWAPSQEAFLERCGLGSESEGSENW